jgi:hypothetical protein
MSNEDTRDSMLRWQKTVLWAVVVLVVVVVAWTLIAGLFQLVVDPTDPDDGKHEIKTITPSGVVA